MNIRVIRIFISGHYLGIIRQAEERKQKTATFAAQRQLPYQMKSEAAKMRDLQAAAFKCFYIFASDERFNLELFSL